MRGLLRPALSSGAAQCTLPRMPGNPSPGEGACRTSGPGGGNRPLMCLACASLNFVDLQERHVIGHAGGRPFPARALARPGLWHRGRRRGAASSSRQRACVPARAREPLVSAKPSLQYGQDPSPPPSLDPDIASYSCSAIFPALAAPRFPAGSYLPRRNERQDSAAVLAFGPLRRTKLRIFAQPRKRKLEPRRGKTAAGNQAAAVPAARPV